MDMLRTGLRYRLRRAARRVARQHAKLDELRGELTAALASADREGGRQALARYRGVLEAHFSLENQVFFPALHGLHPEHRGDLEDLVAEHELSGATLDAIGACIAHGAFADAGRRFERLIQDLSAHEAREETLFMKLLRTASEA